MEFISQYYSSCNNILRILRFWWNSISALLAWRLNLTANAARPNPQGSYHYKLIPVTRTIILANSVAQIKSKLSYAVNGISYVDPETPLKLADYFNISGVFTLNSIKDSPPSGLPVLGTSVIGTTLHDFVEIVFQNTEKYVQSWHLDGYSFYAVGYVLPFLFNLKF